MRVTKVTWLQFLLLAATGVYVSACACGDGDLQEVPFHAPAEAEVKSAQAAVYPDGGSCNPNFCVAGTGSACCLPSGECGIDFGLGCVQPLADGGPPPATSTSGGFIGGDTTGDDTGGGFIGGDTTGGGGFIGGGTGGTGGTDNPFGG